MLVRLTQYNIWANRKITANVIDAGEDAADKEIVSSFSSIRKTVYHIWDAENIWLTRLNGNSITSWPSKEFKGSLQEACNAWLGTSSDLIDYAKLCRDYDQPITYLTTEKKEYTQTVEEIISHCMNHSTYHRGQLITMLRQVGYDKVSNTDMIRYFREVTK